MFYKKIIFFLKSWHKFNFDKDYSCIVFGPQDKEALKNFKENYLYIDPVHYNFFHINLLFDGIFIFIGKFIERPFFLLSKWKFWLTIFFVGAIIKRKKIKILMSLVDYNPWPYYFKNLFKDDVCTVIIQNTSRSFPIDRAGNINKSDKYFLWNELGSNEEKKLNLKESQDISTKSTNITFRKKYYFNQLKNDYEEWKNSINLELRKFSNKTELIKFGSLKGNVILETKKKWHLLEKYPSLTQDIAEIFLISTFQFHYVDFKNKYFLNINFKDYLNKINELESLYASNKIKFSLFDLQCLEFLRMCDYLKNFSEENNIKINIFERDATGKELFKAEKFFFNQVFKNYKFSKQKFLDRYSTILDNKDSIFCTNISSLGRECFGMNRKVILFSKWLYKFNPDFFQKESIFCSIEENQDEFNSRLKRLINMDSSDFTANKEKVKNTVPMCFPDQKNFDYFLKTTGLELNL